MKKKGILKNAKGDSTPSKGNVIFDEANLDANLAERPEGGYMSIDEPKVTREAPSEAWTPLSRFSFFSFSSPLGADAVLRARRRG